MLAAERVHGDDTPVPVLAKGKTATARAWVYVRDDAPFGGPDPPAALFRYSRDRSGDHPVEHLRTFTGILQADIYAGYNRLYAAGRSPRPVTEAACWSHCRRKFFELADIAAGVVTLTAIWPACGRRRRRLCNGRHLPPLSHRVAAELAECSAGDQMALDVEEVVDGRMDGEEPLRGRGRFEPLHLSLSSSHRLM